MAGAHSPILRVGFLTVRRTGVTRVPARPQGYNRLAPGERQPVGEAGKSDGIAGVSCSAGFIESNRDLDSLTAGNARVNFA